MYLNLKMIINNGVTQMFDHSQLGFKVEKFPLINEYQSGFMTEQSPISSSIGVGIRRVDNKQPLGIVSDKYEVVQYMDIVDGVEQAISKSGMDLTDAQFATNVYDDGAKIELTAKFPAHQVAVGVSKGKTDDVIPEFKFRTSQNRTWANNGMMGLWRSACYNTLVSGDKLAYVYGRHTKGFNVDRFATKIQNAGEFISGNGLTEMREWYGTRVSRDQAVNLFTKTLAKRMDNVTKKEVGNKVMLSNLMKIFDEENRHLHGKGNYEKYGSLTGGTMWTAYQASTSWSTHVEGHSTNRTQAKAYNARPMREDRVRKMLGSDTWKDLLVA
jgi:hypothetical protein